MILKQKDSIKPRLKQLEKIKALNYLSEKQKAAVEKQLRILRAGDKGEQDSAYFLNFKYQDSPDFMLIHDLRLKYKGLTAQIDHLLINRLLDFYVLETKSFSQGMKITETGEFLRLNGKQYSPIESPIEQNNRHILLLEKFVLNECQLPKRLGIQLKPNFLSYILVSPGSQIIRPKPTEFNTDTVIKSDQFSQAVKKRVDETGALEVITALAKIVSSETIKDLGEQILKFHHPKKINYFKQLGIPTEAPSTPKKIAPSTPKKTIKPQLKEMSTPSKYFCAECKASISKKVAMFCFQNKQRFQGKAYCFNCQKNFST